MTTRASSHEVSRVIVAVCDECDESFDPGDVGGPVYECSRCGQTFVGDDGNRCPECNIFAAKVADVSCPECEADPGGLDEVEMYETADGARHDSVEEAEEWIADADGRAARQAEWEVTREAEREAKRRERLAAARRYVAVVDSMPLRLPYHEEGREPMWACSLTLKVSAVDLLALLDLPVDAPDDVVAGRLRVADVDLFRAVSSPEHFGAWASDFLGLARGAEFGVRAHSLTVDEYLRIVERIWPDSWVELDAAPPHPAEDRW